METKTPILDYLSDPTHWTKKSYARSANGFSCHAKDPAATCFCLMGALTKLSPPGRVIESMAKLENAIDTLPNKPAHLKTIVDFNDSDFTTHEKIVEVLKIAQI